MMRSHEHTLLLQESFGCVRSRAHTARCFVTRLFFFLCCFALLSCSEKTVLQDLSQEQAHAVVAALVEHGIGAQVAREGGAKALYRVQVEESAYSEAVALLSKLGLPGEARPSLSSLLTSQGLFPNSRALEALRLERAQAAEIEEALLTHPAMQAVRAIVKRDESQVHVAVVISKRNDSPLDLEAVKKLIITATPGLTVENLTLVVDETPQKHFATKGVDASTEELTLGIPLTEYLGLWRMPYDEHGKVSGLLAVALVFATLVGFLLGWGVSWFRRRTSRATRKPELRALNPEAQETTKLLQR